MMAEEKNPLNGLVEKVSEKDIQDLRYTIIYIIVMLFLSVIAYALLFDGFFELRDFNDLFFFDYWDTYISGILGFLTLFAIGYITLNFLRLIVGNINTSRMNKILTATFNTMDLPVILTEVKEGELIVFIANRKAESFYGDKKLKGEKYANLDDLISSKLQNEAKWKKEHEEREKIAVFGQLNSSTINVMEFKSPHLESNKWRLTTSPISLASNKYYFTIYAPAEEDDKLLNSGTTP